MGTAVLLVMTAAGFTGILYAWAVWRGQLRKLEVSAWRMRCAMVGLIAVTLQAAIFIAFWTPLFRDDALVARWTRGELLLILIAIPGVLAGKGRLRWWLLSTSVVLMIGSFFISLSP